jgi:hypothetical protein
LDKGEDVLVIEKSFSESAVSRVRSAGGTVIEADATDKTVLKKRGQVQLASEIYISCGANDINAKVIHSVADCIHEEQRGTSDKLTRCFANITTREQRHHLHNKVDTVDGLWLYSYDVPTATARELLQSVSVDRLDQNKAADRVSVVIVGWTEYTRAILTELCYTMHYDGDLERSIDILCESPNQAKEEFLNEYPGVNESNWQDDRIKNFVRTLFPDISFKQLSAADERIITGESGITDQFSETDVLTMIVDTDDSEYTNSIVALMKPHLEKYERDLNMDTHVLYFDQPDHEASQEAEGIEPIKSDVIDITPFVKFWDGLDPESIKGVPRDGDAQKIALFYHILYEYESENPTTEIDKKIATTIERDSEPIRRGLDDWDDLSKSNLTEIERLCWGQLSEEYRDSNRHAADHARVKLRLADRLVESHSTEEVIDTLASAEHRRWCAEKFLRRWTPLLPDKWDQWDDPDTQQDLRSRRIHRDIWPIETLNQHDPEAYGKDKDQVRFVLKQMGTYDL